MDQQLARIVEKLGDQNNWPEISAQISTDLNMSLSPNSCYQRWVELTKSFKDSDKTSELGGATISDI